tara:strand:+ start:3074 stop:4456 length:1383 start_codon:yes stop_codon:yes gene_type:complete
MNLNNRISKEELEKIRDKIKKVLFFRVCGTGMGAAACLLKEVGFEVFGTDRDYFPPMSTYLEEVGIPKIPFVNINFSEYDLVVVGNVVARGSQEARKIEESGVPFCSFPEIIGEYVLKDKVVIGVSGTHGKTTTTYMLIQILEKLGVRPGYLVGGVINGRPSSSLGNGDYFVIESDEYDTAYFEKTPKFIHYYINHLILTSLEYDHADIYSSIDDIRRVFEGLVQSISGNIVFNNSFDSIDFVDGENAISYGQKSINGPKEIRCEGDEVCFDLFGKEVFTNIFGEHNVLNLSAAIIILKRLNFDISKVLQACLNIKLVKRRQEFLGEKEGIIFYDDFAHHPTAMGLTLESFRKKFQNKELSVVFEPASSTARSDVFENEFCEVLNRADRVFIVEPQRSTSALGAKNIDVEGVVSRLNKEEIFASSGGSSELDCFLENTESGIVIFMSNGKLLGIKEKLFG